MGFWLPQTLLIVPLSGFSPRGLIWLIPSLTNPFTQLIPASNANPLSDSVD